MKRIVFVTPSDPPHGFAAAGFEQLTTELEAAGDVLEETVSQDDVGVVIVDERLLEGIDVEWLHQVQSRWAAIVLVLPSPAGAVPVEEDYLQRLIRRALGYHVRIRE